MTFGRQKRFLLGLLALLAPLPLPFNEIVEWPVLLAYEIGVIYFLHRASLDPPRWLPLWAMNVIGFAYLPIFVLDLLVLGHGRLVHPVVHLCLFALLVKLFSLSRERDKWQAALGVFFLFLASMGTSVHPSIALYLLGFCGLGMVLLTRFAFLHVLAGFGREEPALAELPLKGFLTLAVGSIVLLAVPLFAILPRVRSPYIVGRGAGTGTVLEAAGFSDSVNLDSIGVIRDSREVAIRMQDETPANPDRELRFKAGTFDVYEGGSWKKTRYSGPLEREQRVRFRLGNQPPKRWAKIFLQPLHSRSLPLPVETAVLEPRVTGISTDVGGSVTLEFTPLEVIEYRVGLADRPVLTGEAPHPESPGEPSLDLSGVTPRMTELAKRVMGEGPAAQRAKRLETHLIQSYGYTRDFRDRSTENPLDDFLFRYRSGHCEYFASSMVLLLRSQGIPARLVTGFLGGDYNPFEGYTIVRNSNAHAWVEAYLPGEGWQIFDPTPPAGRPAEAEGGMMGLAQQGYDFLLFRWDRYVLTFGLYDQIRILSSFRELWHDLFRFLDRRGAERPSVSHTPSKAPAAPIPAVPELGTGGMGVRAGLLALVGIALAVGGWLLRLYRTPLTATRAYRKLRRRLGKSGAPLPESTPPLVFRSTAAARYPRAADPTARIIDLYLRESFGGEPLEDEELEALKVALVEAERGMRRAG
jgi:transglutaminase-like putative cysteine protease